MNWQSAWIWTE